METQTQKANTKSIAPVKDTQPPHTTKDTTQQNTRTSQRDQGNWFDTTHTTVTDSSISSKTTGYNDTFSLQTTDPPDKINYPIYVEATVHHDTESHLFPKNNSLEPETIKEILTNAITIWENQKGKPLTTVHECKFIITDHRDARKKDLYSIYQMTMQPKSPYTSYDDCNEIIEIFYDLFGTNNIKHLTLPKDSSTQAKEWIPFVSFNLPRFNTNEQDKSFGLLLGLSPDIHGRHHLTCKWILQELFRFTHTYLPETLQCHHLALFKNTFAIREGRYKTDQHFQVFH